MTLDALHSGVAHPVPRRLRFRSILTLLAVAALSSAGCGFVPTWGQLTGTATPPPAPVVVAPPPVMNTSIPKPPSPPPPPPKPKPEEVIAKFQALKPHEINDGTLQELTQLEEGLEAIEELQLVGGGLTAAGLKNLDRLTHLARIEMRGSQLEQSAFPHIAKATSLEELRVEGRMITVEAARALQPLSNLKVLVAHGLNLTPFAWEEFLAAHPNLEELSIMQSNVSDLVMPAIGKLTNLKRLMLNDTGISDLGLSKLSSLEHLEHLNLSGTRIHGVGFRAGGNSKGFAALHELVLQRVPLDDRGADAIRQMKNLRRLNIAEMPSMLDVHFIRMIKPLDELEYLTVIGNIGLTGQAMTALAGNDHLEEINLGGCSRVDNLGLKFLSKCKNLKKIDISNTACTLEGALALKEILPDVQVSSN